MALTLPAAAAIAVFGTLYGAGARAVMGVPLTRIPAPIFASLATATLLGNDGSLSAGPTLGAAMGALIVSPARSLLLCLIGGAAGYAVSALFR